MDEKRIPSNVVKFDGPLAREIGEWAAEILGPYLAQKKNRHQEAKQIHDPIGKVVVLDKWEVYILDSPIFQRLRYIRQLGVGHFLFPSAGYSRFEHSIGAMKTASDLFDSVMDERSSPEVTHPPKKIEEQRRIVRLAALLHDVGHCVFSHVSEKFYARSPMVDEAVVFFRNFYLKEVTPSESLSLLILQTPAFEELVKQAGMARHELAEDAIIELVCACIAGSKQHTFPDCYLAEIINSPVDCDKLDYLARDAHMAGVPVSLDIQRLLSKIRVVKVEDDDEEDDDPYEAEILQSVLRTQSRNKEVEPNSRFSLAIVPSAARAVEELLVSRIFLFDKFYFHPKVMAAEELLRRALEHIEAAIPAFGRPAFLLRFGDDEFLNLTPKKVIAATGNDLPPGVDETNSELIAGCALLHRAKIRDLPRRVYAFAERYLPKMPELLGLIHSRGKSSLVTYGTKEYRDLIRHLESAKRSALVGTIASYASELGVSGEVFLAHQAARRATGNINIPVKLADGTVAKKAPFLFEASTWTEAYAANKATSYVFAFDREPGERVRVHLAAERALAERDLSFAPNCALNAKLGDKEIEAVRQGLGPTWIDHRLPRDFLDRKPARRRLEKQVQRFSTFLKQVHEEYGPMLPEAWVWQFTDPDLRDSALCLLEHITYIEAEKVRSAFNGFKSKSEELQKALWVPLRLSKGSSSSADQLGVYLKHLGLDQNVVPTIRSVTAADIETHGRVVFFDDSLNSGVQVTTLLASWMDFPDQIAHLDDADTGPLPQDVRLALQKAQINFAYYSAHPVGNDRLRAVCKILRLEIGRIWSEIDSSEPRYRLEGLECHSPASKRRFIDKLSAIGTALLQEKGLTREKAAEFALGYSGIDLTVVYPHSISASTPAALWLMSSDLLDPWIPVFPRKNPDSIVKAGKYGLEGLEG